jgi:hypothetical protein
LFINSSVNSVKVENCRAVASHEENFIMKNLHMREMWKEIDEMFVCWNKTALCVFHRGVTEREVNKQTMWEYCEHLRSTRRLIKFHIELFFCTCSSYIKNDMVSESEEKNGGYSCASEEWTGLTKLMGLIISELIRKKLWEN